MKFCTKCGKQLLDEAVICPGCGCPAPMIPAYPTPVYRPPIAKKKPKSGILGLTITCLVLQALLYAFTLVPGFVQQYQQGENYSGTFYFSLSELILESDGQDSLLDFLGILLLCSMYAGLVLYGIHCAKQTLHVCTFILSCCQTFLYAVFIIYLTGTSYIVNEMAIIYTFLWVAFISASILDFSFRKKNLSTVP